MRKFLIILLMVIFTGLGVGCVIEFYQKWGAIDREVYRIQSECDRWASKMIRPPEPTGHKIVDSVTGETLHDQDSERLLGWILKALEQSDQCFRKKYGMDLKTIKEEKARDKGRLIKVILGVLAVNGFMVFLLISKDRREVRNDGSND
jgi:hypothetical protein